MCPRVRKYFCGTARAHGQRHPRDVSGRHAPRLLIARARREFVLLFLSGPVAAHLAWRHAELPAEATVEIGQIAEADAMSDRADRLAGIRVRQQPVSSRQATGGQKLRECGALGLEQALHVTRADAEAFGHARDRQLMAMAVRDDIGFGELQSCRAQSARTNRIAKSGARIQRQRKQIVDIAYGRFE